MTLDDVLSALAVAVYRAGGQAEWARKADVSPALVSAVLRRTRQPSEKLLAALGLERVVRTTVSYRRKRSG